MQGTGIAIPGTGTFFLYRLLLAVAAISQHGDAVGGRSELGVVSLVSPGRPDGGGERGSCSAFHLYSSCLSVD